MGEHFTRGTLECTAYCGRCQAFTQHRVDDVRKGPCLRCIQRLEARIAIEKGEQAAAAALARQQSNLFGDTK